MPTGDDVVIHADRERDREIVLLSTVSQHRCQPLTAQAQQPELPGIPLSNVIHHIDPEATRTGQGRHNLRGLKPQVLAPSRPAVRLDFDNPLAAHQVSGCSGLASRVEDLMPDCLLGCRHERYGRVLHLVAHRPPPDPIRSASPHSGSNTREVRRLNKNLRTSARCHLFARTE